MNKREFVAGSVGTVVSLPLLAQAAPAGECTPLRALMARTRHRPDLVEHPGAATFEAYVGERFTIMAGAGAGEQLVLGGVELVARCASTEQFTVWFASTGVAADDGLRTLAHSTGQQLTLHLERSAAGYDARFNLLA
jgi:hypothetical protein